MVRAGVGVGVEVGPGPVAWSMRSVKPSTAAWRELSRAASCADSMPTITQTGHWNC